MATHPSILAWRIPMDRGAWQAIAHRVTMSPDMTKQFSMNTCEHHKTGQYTTTTIILRSWSQWVSNLETAQ